MSLTVIVDDADPGIGYGPLSDSGKILDPQTLGASYNGTRVSIGGTLHNMSVEDNRSMTYNFTGPGPISMFALLTPGATKVASDEPLLWNCFINDIALPKFQSSQYNTAETQQICTGSGLPDTDNQFVFKVLEALPNVMDILFDYLEYTPNPSATGQTYSFVAVSSSDSDIDYEGDWTVTQNDGFFVNGNGSTMNYTFNGSSITILSAIDGGSVDGNASISISIDNQQPSTLQLEKFVLDTTISNHIAFQSSALDSSTSHTLKLTYLTEDINPPGFVLQSLVVGNGTISRSGLLTNATVTAMGTTVPVSTSTIGMTGTTPPVSKSHPPHNFAGISSGVVVGLMLVLGITFALWWRRRSRNRKLQHRSDTTAVIYPFTVNPITAMNRLLGSPNAVASEIKARRRLLLNHRDALMIRPAKSREVNVQADGAREPEAEHGAPNVVVEDTATDVEQGPVAVHAVDSGLRDVEDRRVSAVYVLPPLYTPA